MFLKAVAAEHACISCHLLLMVFFSHSLISCLIQAHKAHFRLLWLKRCAPSFGLIKMFITEQIKALGPQARWQKENRFMITGGSRRKEISENRNETHPQGQTSLHLQIHTWLTKRSCLGTMGESTQVETQWDYTNPWNQTQQQHS